MSSQSSSSKRRAKKGAIPAYRPPTAAQLAKRNEAFQKLTPAQKAVAIAKDVLERLKTKQIKAETGIWVQVAEVAKANRRTDWFEENVTLKSLGLSKDLQTLVDQKVQCECCALGGAICSLAHFEDRVDLDRSGDTALGRKEGRLKKIFGKNLALIEHAFECGDGYFTGESSFDEYSEEAKRAADFGNRYRSDSARMKAIFTNIIKNNGQFVP